MYNKSNNPAKLISIYEETETLEKVEFAFQTHERQTANTLFFLGPLLS